MKKTVITLLFVLTALTAFAQGYAVKGVIQDALGPVIGATVLEQGTQNGTATGIDGDFVLNVSSADAMVEVSCIGYASQSFKASAFPSVVNLVEDTNFLDEVVVVGYGTQKAKDLTAPIASVKGEELSRQVTSNPVAALQGKVAGVQVINTGVPGGSPSVKIRGVGSIGDYAKPLYVVDGVFVDDIGFISNSDIQDMTILKDASAAAIYGVRAANGVIIISTRKGVTDKVDISYDGYVGVQVPVNIMKLSNREQYVELRNEANLNTTGYTPVRVSDYPASTDWYKELLRPAMTHSHALDISGATQKTNYSLGLSYLGQDGIMKCDNNYTRLNLRSRLDQKVTDWLSIGLNTLISRYKRVDPDSGAYHQAFVNPPVYGIYNDANEAAYPVKFDAPQNYGFGNSYANPFARAYYFNAREKGLNAVFSAYAELKFLQDRLKIKSAYNMEYQGWEYRNFTPEYMVGGSQGTAVSTMSKTLGIRQKHILDNTITYADSKGKHSYSAMLGQSMRIETLSGMTGSGTDIPSVDEQAMYIGNGSQKNRSVSDLNPGPYRFNGLSFFARGTYNYADRYLATVTMRADGSSKYNEKWGFFPSVGLGWVLTGEEFMKDQPIFDYLKLRGSWGLLGNDSVPANSSAILGASGYGASGVFGDTILDGVGAQTVYQSFLRWEVVNEFDVGLDMAFLDNRLTAEADYYNRTTHNVVFSAPVATGGGTAYLLSNNGTVRNQGLELSLGWHDTVGEDFHYSINANVTTVHNRVLSLNGEDDIPGGSVRGNFTTITKPNYAIGTFWGYEIDSIYQKNGEAMLDPQVQSYKAAGYFRYKDQDGNGVIDDDDKTDLGSALPKALGGLDFSLGWKGFDFSVSFQWQAGNKILNAKRMFRDTFPDGNYDLDFYENCWRPDRHSDTYPSAEAMNKGYTLQCNSFFVEDGSHFRIQNVQAGYTFRFKKVVKSLRIYAAAQRPYTFFRYKGFTTEVGGSPIASGIDTSTYPMQGIYTVGAKINF